MFDEEGDGGVIVIQAVGCSILFYSLLENNCPFVVQKVRGAGHVKAETLGKVRMQMGSLIQKGSWSPRCLNLAGDMPACVV